MGVTTIYRVMVDPGHGGEAPGNVNRGVRECDSALSLSGKIKEHIKRMSWNGDLNGPQVKVFLTRNDDRYVGIDNRAKAARADACNAILSVHTNSSINPLVAGAEAFISAKKTSHRGSSYELATDILDHLAPIGLKKRGVRDDSKTRVGSLGVLRETCSVMDAVLVEIGYASNTGDRRIITSSDGKEKIGMAIARAVVEHFGLDPEAGHRAFRDANPGA